jgi:hypothetical protein
MLHNVFRARARWGDNSFRRHPSCEAFNDLGNHPCYKIKCPASPDDYTNYDKCDGQQISASLDGVQLCELPPNSATIEDHISCHTSPNSIYDSYRDNAGNEASTLVGMTCPHSGQKCGLYPNGYGLCPSGYHKNNITGCCEGNSLIASQQECSTVGWHWDSVASSCNEYCEPDGPQPWDLPFSYALVQ